MELSSFRIHVIKSILHTKENEFSCIGMSEFSLMYIAAESFKTQWKLRF